MLAIQPEFAFDRLGKALSGGIYQRKFYLGLNNQAYAAPALQAIEDWN